MTKLKSLIKLNEHLIHLDSLYDGISYGTETGKAWIKLINSLETILNEVKDFKDSYPPSIHGPLPNIQEGFNKLAQINHLCHELKPLILGMDDIQKKDI